MKRFYILLFLFITLFQTHSQDNIFVLVDVSLSVKQSELNNAKQTMQEVLTGASLTKAIVSQGNLQDLNNFRIKQGDKISFSRFGSLTTTLAIHPVPVTIQNLQADVNQALNSITWTPVDGQTYLTLAKAKIAEYAKNNNINKYKLYIISDNVNDDYGQNGLPNYPDNYTQNLVENYNTSTNPVSEAGYTKLKFSQNSLFTLSFSPAVDITNYSLPTNPTPAPTPTPVSTPKMATIKIASKAKKGKENEVKKENVNINWTCTDCPSDIRYTVTVSEYDGGKFKETRKELTSSTVTLKLPDGKFKITVSASNYTSVTSDTTYIRVNTGSYAGIIIVLLLLLAGGAGYYLWNKRSSQGEYQQEKKANELFAKKNDTTNNNSYTSNNSDYF